MATRTLTNTATIVQDVTTPGEVLLNLNLVGGDASINTGTGALTVSKIGGSAVTLGGALTISGAFGTTLTVTNTTTLTLPTTGTLAILGANIFTALQTITQGSANAGILVSTGYSLTGSNATSMLSLAGTVNTSGNPNILSCAITNTAAGASTKYLNLLAGAAGATSIFSVDLSGNVILASSLQINANGIQTSPAAATLQLGAADAASPVAQSLRVQNVVAGTSNTAGANFTVKGSVGTGTGAGGSLVFQTAPAGTTGTSQNALVSQLTIASTGLATFAAPVVFPSFATGARTATTDGVGAVYYNSTLNNPQFSDGTNWKTIPDLSDAYTWASAQTFTLGIILGSAVPLTGPATGALQLGAADAAAPVAQIIQAQSVVAGTSNTAGTNLTIKGSVGTGTGAGGQIILQTAPASTTGTTQNTLSTALTITTPVAGQLPSIVLGSAALATTATDGFLYVQTCAGTPTGVPTAFTGRTALIYDTTAHQFWIYDGGWKQPKTPAAAAIVTWQ